MMIWLILGFLPGSAISQYRVVPFYTHNQSPLIHFLGLPNSEGGVLTSAGKWGLMFHINVANNASSKRIYHERIYLDGEMFRGDISFRYGVNTWLELGLDIPVVRHSSGLMDPLIAGWHETFDLPGRARKAMPTDAIRYVYNVDGVNQIEMTHPNTGVGDISLLGGIKLVDGINHHLCLRCGLKMPTGNKNGLIGSGTMDYSLQLNGTLALNKGLVSSQLFYGGGILFLGQGGLLEDIQRNSVGFGSLGWAMGVGHRIVPKIQMDWHTSVYGGSNTKQLGKTSIQLVLGADWVLGAHGVVQLGFVEDLIVNTAPDVVFHVGYNYFF